MSSLLPRSQASSLAASHSRPADVSIDGSALAIDALNRPVGGVLAARPTSCERVIRSRNDRTTIPR